MPRLFFFFLGNNFILQLFKNKKLIHFQLAIKININKNTFIIESANFGHNVWFCFLLVTSLIKVQQFNDEKNLIFNFCSVKECSDKLRWKHARIKYEPIQKANYSLGRKAYSSHRSRNKKYSKKLLGLSRKTRPMSSVIYVSIRLKIKIEWNI